MQWVAMTLDPVATEHPNLELGPKAEWFECQHIPNKSPNMEICGLVQVSVQFRFSQILPAVLKQSSDVEPARKLGVTRVRQSNAIQQRSLDTCGIMWGSFTPLRRFVLNQLYLQLMAGIKVFVFGRTDLKSLKFQQPLYAKSAPGGSQLFTGTARPSFAIAARPSPQQAIFGDGDVPSTSPSFCHHWFCQSC